VSFWTSAARAGASITLEAERNAAENTSWDRGTS
jgi:hypothetical protein